MRLLTTEWNAEARGQCTRQIVSAAKPFRVKYRTVADPIGPLVKAKVASAGKSPKLVEIIERIRSARRRLTSVSEDVRLVLVYSWRPTWWGLYRCEGASFKMQGQRQFSANIDRTMGTPFRVGSDGTVCWFRVDNKLTTCPFDKIAFKNLLFCDPFRAEDMQTSVAIVEKMKLEYLGDVLIDGKPCHKIRSWDVKMQTTTGDVSPVRDWYIDTQTLLPVRFEWNGEPRYEYKDTRIDERISDKEFQLEPSPAIQIQKPEPLDQKYTHRFLNVIDGSDGRLSVRWGRVGDKGGRISSGLN